MTTVRRWEDPRIKSGGDSFSDDALADLCEKPHKPSVRLCEIPHDAAMQHLRSGFSSGARL
jgi:hypothetical protein